ncbi:helix-turn-helix domain-containing protein [Listeria monocytogenes]
MDKLDNYIMTILEKSITPRKLPFLHTVLAGRRTGQAVQDIHLFQMQHLFGLVPNLKANYLESRLSDLVRQGSIVSTENGYVIQEQQVPSFATDYPDFLGFTFQRQAFAFFAHLRLAVQVVSNIHHHESYYLPVIRDKKIQQFIKHWLKSQDKSSLADALYEELFAWMEKLAVARPAYIVERFSGGELMGYTTEQIATKYQAEKWDVYFEVLHEIHRLLSVMKNKPEEWPILVSLVPDELAGLTSSAMQTYSLWQNGADLEAIERIRNLKMSTIHDHFVEIRATLKEADVPYLPEEEVIQTINTKKWNLLREIKAEFPDLDYYQIRLAVVSREGER